MILSINLKYNQEAQRDMVFLVLAVLDCRSFTLATNCKSSDSVQRNRKVAKCLHVENEVCMVKL